MIKKISQDEEFLNLLPSKWWISFFKKFDEIGKVPIPKWKPIHHLSYFTQRYEDVYGKRFSFALDGQPSRCKEIFMIKKIMAILGTSNQKTVKDYIDWVFDNKVISVNRKVRSIGFFANASFCNEFHLSMIEKNKIKRGTPLPTNYQIVVDILNLPINTYGDLAFAKRALDEAPDSESRNIYRYLFKELYRVGFEYSMLEEIK